MQERRKIIEIDEEKCNGCGLCVPNCAEGSLVIVDGKAKVIADRYCDGLGACLGHCPQGALRIIEREADAFDEAAVEAMLAKQGRAPLHAAAQHAAPAPGGCPGARVHTLTPCQQANIPRAQAGGASALSHWPVQIRLVPPSAPFLKGANLLVTADCAPVACPSYHSDFLPGRVALLGCPKFDDVQSYVDKFAAIMTEAAIASVLVMQMEVPCCSGLAMIVDAARKQAGCNVPVEVAVISLKGEVLSRRLM
ncbi:MAG: ATP-binding protein [Desulfovibrionaceae bacterium]